MADTKALEESIILALRSKPSTANQLAALCNVSAPFCRNAIARLRKMGLVQIVEYQERKTSRGNTASSQVFGLNPHIFSDENKLPVMINTTVNAGVSIPILLQNAVQDIDRKYSSGIFTYIQENLPRVLANRLWDCYLRTVPPSERPKTPTVGMGAKDDRALRIMIDLLDGMADGLRQILVNEDWWVGSRISQATDFPHWEQIQDIVFTLGKPEIPDMFRDIAVDE